jgi:squalene-associated FAD-dependent desaturase
MGSGPRAGWAYRVNGRVKGQLTGDVCVIGGGLAGITAALRLADASARVTLLEARPDLGGATYSFRRAGLPVDTGQHVFLRCYHRYRELLERLGTAGDTDMQDRFTVPVLSPGRAPHLLIRRRLPAPAHLLPALAGYRLLSRAERFAAITAAGALRAVDPDDPACDEATFGGWLTEHRQSARAVHRLWDLITIAALNVPASYASLALAARVFRTGLLERADAGDIGRPRVPLGDLHAAPARRLLHRLGARVLTRARAEWVRADDGVFTIGVGGGHLIADAVILAVPHRAATTLVPRVAAPDAAGWLRLGSSPIVNVHLRYAWAVADLGQPGPGFAATIDSPAQWIFDRSVPEQDGEQHLVISLSAAEDAIGQPTADLVATQRAAITELFPAARDTPVRDAFVTREPHATFRQTPGTRAFRPAAATRLPGLALAGSWTDTGWPDTMEGAVRSGHAAADVIIGHLAQEPSVPLMQPEAAR